MQPKRAFTSKFADPNHDTNKSPISLATGGAVPYNTTWRKDLRDREEGRRQRKIADVSSSCRIAMSRLSGTNWHLACRKCCI